MEPDNPALDDYVLGLTSCDRPRVCFVPTACGDSDAYIARFYAAFGGGRSDPTHLPLFQRDGRDMRSFLLNQDVIYVGGGNVANLLVVWRLHGVDGILRDCWQAGVILCGISAGMNCWFEGCSTDSFGPLAPLRDGLGFLTGSVCPHYDGEAQRRPTYRTFIETGALPPGYAAEDGAALHFVGTTLRAVMTSRPCARAFAVTLEGGHAQEAALDAHCLVASS